MHWLADIRWPLSPMAESETRDWILGWVEDLHKRAESMRFWEEEQKRIVLET